MISVDSSVWIELLRGTRSAVDLELRRLIDADEPLAVSELVITEVLRGCRDEGEAGRVERALLSFPLLRLRSPDDFVFAAALHRRARRAGVTIRSTIDCLIAAPCIRHGIPLLHSDSDFDRLATCTELQIHPV